MTESGASGQSRASNPSAQKLINSVQPYLAEVEKKWIAFQLLTCLRDTRISKVGRALSHQS